MGFTDMGPVASSVTRMAAAQRPAPRVGGGAVSRLQHPGTLDEGQRGLRKAMG